MIAIIDYGAGNLRSVANAFASLGHSPVVTNDAKKVLAAQAIILPGVGAAADSMRGLRTLGLVEPIRRVIGEDKPFFGVCLGLQVLFSATEEGGWHDCLDIIPGVVRKLPPGLKVPHMGWNQVRQRVKHPIFEGIRDGANFYFVHSYYGAPEDADVIAGETDYGVTFGSMVIRGKLIATQFHPEKSGKVGLKMYHNFLKLSGVG
ncbi:MAG: imidazole glycerol phosphate synthase subunit HisH [Chloroflexi bacterium]|nr:imidazole glycerol phosphate synthase subunit HisH [Chloroflexota bacterium]